MATLASILHSFLNLHPSCMTSPFFLWRSGISFLTPLNIGCLGDLLWPKECCRSVSVLVLSLVSLCPSTVSQSPATIRTNLAYLARAWENTLRRAHFFPFKAILDKPKVSQPPNMWVPAKIGRATNPAHTWPQTYARAHLRPEEPPSLPVVLEQ